MNSMWWPAHLTISGFIHQTVFLCLSALTAFNFVMGSLCGPRYLALGWRPRDTRTEKYLQFCQICEGFKAPRSHHCRKCGRCVMKMDHHCPWINNCVGWGNHAYFTAFLSFAVLGCLQATIILSFTLYRGIHRQWYIYYGHPHLATVHLGIWSLIFCIFSLGLAIGVVIAVGMLLFFQLRAIVRNRTGIEDWILEKAKYRREESGEQFVYPYDLGASQNVREVLSWTCEPIGDGIEWHVVKGCDQFTLTKEQIAQKAEKRARTKTYEIIRPVSGSWIPFWSQGFKTTVNPPYTDESRLRLSVGEIVAVTRWRKYWLFGEPVASGDGGTNGGNGATTTEKAKKKLRGWFPRQCAVELEEDYCENHNSHPHHNLKKKKDK